MAVNQQKMITTTTMKLESSEYFDGFVVEFVPRAGSRVFTLDVIASHRRSAISLRLLPLDLDEVLGAVDDRRLAGRVRRV